LKFFYEELKLGDIYKTPSRTITEADVVNFAAYTGDYHLLHTSENYAKQMVFGKRIVHGLLLLAVSHGLMFRTNLTEEGIALIGIEDWKFMNPVFIGDTIFAEIKILDKRVSRSKTDRGIVKFQFTLKKCNDDQVVQQGIKVLMIKRYQNKLNRQGLLNK